MNGLEIKKILKKWSFSVLTPALICGSMSMVFIWVYLLRMGHQEIFLELVTLSSVFLYLSIFVIASISLYFFVFFSPCVLVSSLILANNKNSELESKFRRNIPSVFLLASLLCAVFFIVYTLIATYCLPKESCINLIVAIVFFVVSFLTICFICWMLNKNIFLSLRYREEKNKAKRLVLWHSLIVFVGMFSYSSVFHVLLLSLGFAKEDSVLWQVFVVFVLLVGSVVFTSIPLFFCIDGNGGIFKRVFYVSGSVVVVLFFSSFMMPSIPVFIINMALRLSGVIDVDCHRYAVPLDSYPVEYFDSLGGGNISGNGKFYLFKGVKMFSFGSVRLICPAEISNVYLGGLKGHFMDSESNEKSRGKLQEIGIGCRRFKADELNDIGEIIKPSGEGESLQ